MTDLDRLARARAVMAYIVLRHGAAYAPLLDRLDAEYEEARRGDPAARARRILDGYKEVGERRAILLSHS